MKNFFSAFLVWDKIFLPLLLYFLKKNVCMTKHDFRPLNFQFQDALDLSTIKKLKFEFGLEISILRKSN